MLTAYSEYFGKVNIFLTLLFEYDVSPIKSPSMFKYVLLYEYICTLRFSVSFMKEYLFIILSLRR